MKSIETTETNYSKITERIVHYRFHGAIREYKQSYNDRLSCVFDAISGDCLSDHALLRNIQTNAKNPLDIFRCCFWIQNRRW